MGLIFRSMGRYKRAVAACIFVKLLGTLSELMLPYILEYIIDDVAPLGSLPLAVLWGLLMFAAALICRQLNVTSNRRAVQTAHRVSYDIRQELFAKTANLSGSQFDSFGLPSLISRMTSDSYDVQTAAQQLQSLCVRAPMLLIGGVIVSLVMDVSLAMILIAMLPVLIVVVIAVTAKGLPMYNRVQQKLDTVVRVMRENITGIRVVKALSKIEYEKRRFAKANQEMTDSDISASTMMAVPSPLMQLCLNGGLALLVMAGYAIGFNSRPEVQVKKPSESRSESSQSKVNDSSTEKSSGESSSQSETNSENKAASSNSQPYEITYQNYYMRESYGRTYIDVIVEITNTGNVDLYLDCDGFDFEDSEGRLVATSTGIFSGSSDPDVIAPGEKGYLWCNGESIHGKNLSVNGNYVLVPVFTATPAKGKPDSYSIMDVSFTEKDNGNIDIIGRAENDTDEEESYVWISIMLYDKDGKPLTVFGRNLMGIPARGKSSFDTTVPDRDINGNYISRDSIADYKIYAESMYFQFD